MSTKTAPDGATYCVPTYREIRMLQVGLSCALLAGRSVIVHADGGASRVTDVHTCIEADKIRYKVEGVCWWQWITVDKIKTGTFTVAGVDIVPAWQERGQG